MKINKLVYVMFCICMFFCGCMTTPSLVSVQRKDNSEPLKLGTIVRYSNGLTSFCVGQVLNNRWFELDHDDTNIWYVSQMVLAHAYTEQYDTEWNEKLWLDDRYMSVWIVPSEGYVYANGQAIAEGYYMYLGNHTYETVGKNPDGSPKYNTVRVFCEVDAPTDLILK